VCEVLGSCSAEWQGVEGEVRVIGSWFGFILGSWEPPEFLTYEGPPGYKAMTEKKPCSFYEFASF
jgi:hypothetical protein